VLNVAGEPVKIVVPPGVEDGDRLRVRGEGEPVGDGTGDSGDLILHVKVAPSHLWTRRRLELEMSLPVTIPEAVAGAAIDVPTPRGPVTVDVPSGIEPGTRLRLEGRGVEREGERGDLLLTVLIQMPDALDDELREFAESLEAGYEKPVRKALWDAYRDGESDEPR
jgi:curved DNA-binding protein